MADPLDNIIFVGFPIPDKNTEAGANTYRHIMDAANVPKENIFFYPEGTKVTDIIRKTFTFDQSQKFNYRIGRTICIGSDNVGVTYRHKLELLDKKIEIPVKTGYEHVDMSTLTESEIAYWLKNGRYKSIRTDHDDDDIISGLLDGSFDLEYTEEEDYNGPKSEEDLAREGVLTDPATRSLDYYPSFVDDEKNEIDFDSMISEVDESNNSVSKQIQENPQSPYEPSLMEKNGDNGSVSLPDDSSEVETSEKSSIQENNNENEEEKKIHHASDVDDILHLDETPVYQEPEPEPEPEEETKEDFLNNLFDADSPSDMSQDFDEITNEPEDSYRGISTGSPSGGWNSDDVYPSQEEIQAAEKEKSEDVHIPIDDMDIVDDDMEYVRKAERNIQRAQARERAKAREEEQIRDEELEVDEDMFRDHLGESSNEMNQKASHAAESRYTADGRKKNYRDYLSPDEAQSQIIAERTREKFGDMNIGYEDEKFDLDYDQKATEPDLKYVGEGTGRIIMVTSGKGGVGKSLVANGMAMALSLGRAKDLQSNPGASNARTWLIESDYNSPHLAMAFKTGSKNLGNVAEMIAGEGKAVERGKIRRAIEENVFVDPSTGIHVLACPPLSSRKSSKEIPFAILLAVKYASDNGDDVIIDHGNLTSGQYSELDQVLSLQMAHRVVMVMDMNCVRETQSALQILCDRERNSVVPARPVPSVSIVLNNARQEQVVRAQKQMRPFEIINRLPMIEAFSPQNSLAGSSYLTNAPKEIQKAVMDRCGIMMTKLGYESMRKYFSIKSSFNGSKRTNGVNIFKKLSNFLAGSD